jgi:uncharacterized protein
MDRRTWLLLVATDPWLGREDWTDSYGDGTPDFLRLTTRQDQTAFRRWFAFLAEVAWYTEPGRRPAELTDCGALLRYAYREGLREHNGVWAQNLGLPALAPIPEIRKYHYPHTPLHSALFRTIPGPPNRSAFREFADAQTLMDRNTFRLGVALEQARPGDLLFYRQASGTLPVHSMIWLGPSQVEVGSERFVVYHTGPQRRRPGEIRRLPEAELREHPDPRWRPVAANPAFLGVFRWNILRDPT